MSKRIVMFSLVVLACATLSRLLFDFTSRIPASAGPGILYKGRTVQDWVHRVWFANQVENPEIQTVVEIGAPAVPYLVQRLQNGSYLTRSRLYRKAWYALPSRWQGRLPQPPLEGGGEEPLISSAAYTLGLIGPKAEPAVPALIHIAKDKRLRWGTRLMAVQALGQIGPSARSSVPALVDCLKDDHEQLRREYSGRMQEQHGDAADLRFRTSAARALAQIGGIHPRSEQPLKLLLETTNMYARSSAAVALWRMDGSRSNEGIVTGLLQSADPGLRVITANLLGLVGEPATCFVPMLQTMLKETNNLHDAAEMALSRIRTPSSSNR